MMQLMMAFFKVLFGWKFSGGRRQISMALMLAGWATCAASGYCTADDVALSISARPWPAADSLFHQDPRWLGADDAHSVDLGSGRVLWLFGDTFIDRHSRRDRSRADLIRNSIAIQKGYHPATAQMTFFWKHNQQGNPASYFPESGEIWFWPGDGIRIGKRVLIFLAEIQVAQNPLGFALAGWQAVMIDNPEESPSKWQIVDVKRGSQRFDIVMGTGSVLARDGFVYAYGCDISGHRAYLARWPEADAGAGDLRGVQWWCGQRLGWLAEKRIQEAPAVLFSDAQIEFGVYHDAGTNRFVQIQTIGFGAADLGYRTSPRPEGPWGVLTKFYEPPEKEIPGVLIYAAKPHRSITGTAMALTYATNHMDPQRLMGMATLYFPRVLRVTWETAGVSE